MWLLTLSYNWLGVSVNCACSKLIDKVRNYIMKESINLMNNRFYVAMPICLWRGDFEPHEGDF